MTQQTLKELINTNPEIQKKLLTDNPDFDAAAALINNVPLVANNEQQNVPVMPTLQDVFNLVTPTERLAIAETRIYDRILEAVSLGRIDWVVDNLTTLLAEGNGILSQASYYSLLTVLTNPNPSTIPDPNYQSLVPDPNGSLAQQNGLGFVDAGQVMLAWLS